MRNRSSVAEAARRVPSFRPGKKTHTATVFRWMANGVRGVRLESARLGGRVVTSVEALQRFSDALTAAPPAPSNLPRQTTAARRRSADRAERELQRIGL